MLRISAVYAVVRCLSVYVSATFMHSVETNKEIFRKTSPSGSHTILVSAHRTGANEGVECSWDRQKVAILGQYLASSRVVDDATVKCYTHSCIEP